MIFNARLDARAHLSMAATAAATAAGAASMAAAAATVAAASADSAHHEAIATWLCSVGGHKRGHTRGFGGAKGVVTITTAMEAHGGGVYEGRSVQSGTNDTAMEGETSSRSVMKARKRRSSALDLHEGEKNSMRPSTSKRHEMGPHESESDDMGRNHESDDSMGTTTGAHAADTTSVGQPSLSSVWGVRHIGHAGWARQHQEIERAWPLSPGCLLELRHAFLCGGMARPHALCQNTL